MSLLLVATSSAQEVPKAATVNLDPLASPAATPAHGSVCETRQRVLRRATQDGHQRVHPKVGLHGRIVAFDGHQFGVEVIGFSADPALTRLGPSTAHAQIGMMSVSAPAVTRSRLLWLVTISYTEQLCVGRPVVAATMAVRRGMHWTVLRSVCSASPSCR
jgi:hypothetical protein